jgi:hypothetical protein
VYILEERRKWDMRDSTNIFSKRNVDTNKLQIIRDGSLESDFVEAITEDFTITKLQAYDILNLAKLYAKEVDK